MIGKFREYDYETLTKQLDELKEIHKTGDNKPMVAKMKEIVSEFKNQNSVYESLDK